MINQNKSDGKAASGKRNSKKRYTYRRPVKKGAPRQKKPEESVHIAFLGGMNEIGKNMTLYEYKDDMFIVDCGLAFPTSDLPGVDLVIPDFTYVEKQTQNQGRIGDPRPRGPYRRPGIPA